MEEWGTDGEKEGGRGEWLCGQLGEKCVDG